MIKPFPFQRTGADFLKASPRRLLADEMGLGKTIQTGLAAMELKLKRFHIICPAVAKYNWQRELRHFGFNAHVAGEGDPLADADQLITSFGYATKHREAYLKRPRQLTVADEAHFLKEPTSQRAKAILGSQGLIHNSERFWGLSGTPAPNHAGEVWVWLKIFGYTKLSYEGFIARYCNAYHVGNKYSRVQISGSNTKHTPELKALLKKFSLRRLKKDVLDLPPIFHTPYYIEGARDEDVFALAPELRLRLQEELAFITEKLGIDNDFNDDKLISTLSFLAQAAPSLRRYHGLKKITPTTQLIDFELKNQLYEKVVIFGWHTDVLQLTAKALKRYNPILLTGKTPEREKKGADIRFQNDPSIRVFVGNIQTAGTAITLTAANQVVFIEDDWVPGNNKQAGDRCHRIGQTESVTCRHIIIKDSIDEKITGAVARKTAELATFI